MGIPEFRVVFKTKDDNLIVNRKANPEYYFKVNGSPEEPFIKAVIEQEAREKGVRIVSYKLTKENLTAIVEWL